MQPYVIPIANNVSPYIPTSIDATLHRTLLIAPYGILVVHGLPLLPAAAGVLAATRHHPC